METKQVQASRLIKRGWEPNPGELERRQRQGNLSRLAEGNEWATISCNSEVKISPNIEVSAISSLFFSDLSRNVPSFVFKNSKIIFELSLNEAKIHLRVPAPVNTPIVSEAVDTLSSQIAEGLESGKFLRK